MARGRKKHTKIVSGHKGGRKRHKKGGRKRRGKR